MEMKEGVVTSRPNLEKIIEAYQIRHRFSLFSATRCGRVAGEKSCSLVFLVAIVAGLHRLF